ncbi:aspartate carbamoyltransferase catalytic subunit [Candidatus Ichthyocystis sparus]|uniref:aspartate carbamoyltransferase catalytic subunit n=1 Tax=Candidatus Ichthyocystis sparus TaxID=1561004 RepID=UPI000ACD8D48|nr:aspartate carbamoyltransferase catalytic subunit [Candidatus Ichthyocystis sparus]
MSFHLVDPGALSVSDVERLFELAALAGSGSLLLDKLRGSSVFTVFLEDSTRTRISFEVAARRVGAEVFDFCSHGSSLSKGETFEDTLRNIVSLGADFLIIRHSDGDFFDRLLVDFPLDAHVISGGHGARHHPTQGLLDVFCISKYNSRLDDVSVLILGDVVHSRVARSQVQILKTLGCRDIRLVGPSSFLPDPSKDVLFSSVNTTSSLEEGLSGVDVVSLLRVQRERFSDNENINLDEYVANYGFKRSHAERLKEGAIVIHPQPLNRNLEISDDVVALPCCKFFEQVELGVFMRMACLVWLYNCL